MLIPTNRTIIWVGVAVLGLAITGSAGPGYKGALADRATPLDKAQEATSDGSVNYSNSALSPEEAVGLKLVGGCRWSGMRDAAVRDNYAYVVMHHGLGVFDISNPSEPDLVGFCFIEFLWSWNIDIAGNYAYVVDYNGLNIVDISTANAPILLNEVDIPGDGRDIAVNGSYAYITQMQDGLQIIDISDPFLASLKGSCDTPGSARGIVVVDTLIYIADGSGGLRIINAADPSAPAPLGFVDNIGRPYDLAVLGDYAYMASDTAGVKIIDVSDPNAPSLVTTYKGPVEAENIVGRDTLIYISDLSTGIDIVNVAQPSSPQSIGSLDVVGRVCDVSGYLSMIDYDSSLKLIDIADPQNPLLAGEYVASLVGYEIVVDGDYAYGISSSLNVIDISNPDSPTVAGSLQNVQGTALAKYDTLLFTVGRDSTFNVINVADPINPQLVKTLKPIGYAYDIATDGEYAYVPTWQDGMAVVNVSDPLNPAIVANHFDLGFTDHVFLFGDYLYTGGITIINVADPLNPYEEGFYWGGGTAPGDIVVVDTLAYIAGGDSELMIGMLEIGSVADPTNPYHVGGYGISNEALKVAVEGTKAFVIDYASLLVFDVSDPASPVYLAGRGGPAFIDVAAVGNYIYVTGRYGFLIYTLDNFCGDANNDAQYNISDAVYLIGFIFKGGSPPTPAECYGDANGDGRVNIGDAVYAINYIFRGGPPPAYTCCQ